jgi:serine/threonine-protein kinase RsbW
MVRDPHSIELRVEAGLEQIRLVGVTIRAAAEQFVSAARAQLIELCTVEIATNCVKHAYEGESGHTLRVCFSLDTDHVIVEVRDRGKAIPSAVLSEDRNPFDFDPDETQALPEGGMGLALVSAMAEDSDYFRDDQENVMRMKFQRKCGSERIDSL